MKFDDSYGVVRSHISKLWIMRFLQVTVYIRRTGTELFSTQRT